MVLRYKIVQSNYTNDGQKQNPHKSILTCCVRCKTFVIPKTVFIILQI